MEILCIGPSSLRGLWWPYILSFHFFFIVKPSSCLKSLHSSWENQNSLLIWASKDQGLISVHIQAVSGHFSGRSCSIQREFSATNNLSWMASLSPFPGGGTSCPLHSQLLVQSWGNCYPETSLFYNCNMYNFADS